MLLGWTFRTSDIIVIAWKIFINAKRNESNIQIKLDRMKNQNE